MKSGLWKSSLLFLCPEWVALPNNLLSTKFGTLRLVFLSRREEW